MKKDDTRDTKKKMINDTPDANNCFLKTMKYYKISIDLTYTWEMFQGFFTKKFLDDFGTTAFCFINC